MKKKAFQSLLSSILIVLSSIAYGQVKIKAVPSWVEPIPEVLNTSLKAEEISDGYSNLLIDNQINVEDQSAFYHYSRKIFSDVGVQNGSEIKIDFDPLYERLFFHKITLWRNGVSYNKLDVANFKVIQREKNAENFIYDGTLSAILLLEDVRTGDVIDFSFSYEGFNPIYENRFAQSFTMSFYDPVDRYFLKIISPDKKKLNYKLSNNAPQPTVNSDGNTATYIWDIKSIGGLKIEDQTPSWYYPYPHVSFTEYKSWKEVKDWAYKYFTLKKITDKEILQLAEKIRKQHRDPADQVIEALRFVQNEIRYTGIEAGIGGYKPTDPETVFKRRFGDCKDKSFLLCHILKLLDIDGYPCLVNTNYKSHINEWLPSPNAFNHCIARVRINNTYYWFDPTINYQSGNCSNTVVPDYGKALVLSAESTGLESIPMRTSGKTVVVEKFTMKEIGGEAQLEVKSSYYGEEADFQRYYFNKNDLAEISRNYLNFYAKNFPRITAVGSIKFSDSEEKNVFVTIEKYTIKNLWKSLDSLNSSSLTCSFYPQTLIEKLTTPATMLRKMPLALSYPLNYAHNIEIHLPEPWSVETNEKKEETREFKYSESITYSDDVIYLKYKFRHLTDHVSAAGSADYISSINKLAEDFGFTLTYNASIAQARTPFAVNWLFAFIMLLTLMLTVPIAYWIYLKYDPDAKISGVSYGLEGLLIPFSGLFVLIALVSFGGLFANEYLNQVNWYALAGSSRYKNRVALSTLEILEVIFNVMRFVFCLLLIVLFFKRRTSFPRLLTLFLAINLVWELTDKVAVEMLHENDYSLVNYSASLILAVFLAVICIPYFNASLQVRLTFTKNLNIKKQFVRKPELENVTFDF